MYSLVFIPDATQKGQFKSSTRPTILLIVVKEVVNYL